MTGQDPQLIHVGLKLFSAVIAALVAVPAGLWMVVRRLRTGNAGKTAGNGFQVPVVDSHAIGDSLFHTWDVRFKVVALFTYCLCIAFLTNPVYAALAVLISIVAVLAGRLSMARAMKRLGAMLAFLSLFLVIMPLTAVRHPGDTLVVIESTPLVFNLRGLTLALTIVLKASAIALMMEPLFNTAPLSLTVNGLQRIGVPSQVCQMLLMAHRYIFVFLHEINRMSMGMKVRGFRKRSDFETLRVMGNFVGMLMVRSIDRTERVYQAMLARGYSGTFPVFHEYTSVPLDWFKAAVWVGLGLGLMILDLSGRV